MSSSATAAPTTIKYLVLDDVDGEFMREDGTLVVSARGRGNKINVMEMADVGGITLMINNEGEAKDGVNATLRNKPWALDSVAVLNSGSLAFVGGTPSDAKKYFKKGKEIEFATSDDAVIKTVPPVGACLKLMAMDRSMIDSPRTSHSRMSLICRGTSHIRVGRVSTALAVRCDAESRVLATHDEECVTVLQGNTANVKQYVDPDVRKEALNKRNAEKEQRARQMAIEMKRMANEYLEELDEELADEERARIYGAAPLEEELEILDDHVMDAGDIQAVTDKENPNPERTILDRLDDYVAKLIVLARLFGYVRPTMFFEFMVNTSDLQSNLNARQRASLVEKLNQKEAELLTIAPPPGPGVPAKATLESDPRDQCINCYDMRGDRVLSCGHDHYCEGCIVQWVLSRPAGSPPICTQCRQEVKWVRTMGDPASEASSSSSSSPSISSIYKAAITASPFSYSSSASSRSPAKSASSLKRKQEEEDGSRKKTD